MKHLTVMTRYALLAMLMIPLCGANAIAQDWARQLFATTNHDFGTIEPGANAEFNFELHNALTMGVRISTVTSGCPCTTVEVSQKWMRPGDRAFVKAKMNTEAYAGVQAATITIEFDQPFQASVALQVKADIRRDD